ncbi:MAG: carboxypeptidase Taq [Gaiellales bacterium]|jgi:carboxypeptidase Taq|nr:carboxypeptidase Taq [Gaiellales bacterium]
MAAAAWDPFERRMHELIDLGGVAGIIGWDQQVMMPPKGAEIRAHQSTALASLMHERVVDPAYGEAIDRAEAEGGTLDEAQRASLREARRDRDRAVKVPGELVREIAMAEAEGFEIWQKARPDNDFASFRPVLERLVSLKQQEADAIGHDGERYDALLDAYEPGMRLVRLEPLLHELRDGLVPLVAEIAEKPVPDTSFLAGDFPAHMQLEFSERVIRDLGFDMEAGRQDESAHPFTSGAGPYDVRLTTRIVDGDPRASLMGTIHETGHGLYEQGIVGERIERTFAGMAPSLGLHESQSRLWENQIGRSRAFWEHYYPSYRQAFPDALAGVDLEQWLRAINIVQPSLIRVEADELTYNLHILIRFELEVALLRGDLAVADLPGAWNDAYRAALGVVVPSDSDGVLQDVHWSGGAFGYFPTYTLGNLYSAQLMEAAARDLGDLDGHFRRGEFLPLLGWMRTHIHSQGSLRAAEETAQAATGKPLEPTNLLAYLRAKYGALYQLA